MKNIFYKLTFLAIVIAFNFTSIYAATAGALDSSFGVAGKVSTNILGKDLVRDIAQMDNGKIVAVGSSGTNDFTVVRYNANGTLDTSFSNDGIVFTDFTGGTETPMGVAIQNDGKIVVTGSNYVNPSLFVARYNNDGSLDTTFDTDGKVTLTFANGLNGNDVKIQTDGKLVIIGGSGSGFALPFSVIRLNQNGSLDTSFDTDGIALVPTLIGSAFSGEVLPDGKIVIGGAVSNNLNVVRFNPNGSLDTTFNGDGIATFDINATSEIWNELTVQSNGRILITGRIGSVAGVVRLTSTGNLDTTFAGDGSFEFTTFGSFANSIKLQSDGKIIVCGSVGSNLAAKTFVAKLLTGGTLDSTFGNSGISVTDQNGSFDQTIELVGDKLLVGLSANYLNVNEEADFGLQRFNLSITPSESGDFDGDGFTDTAVFRPSTGNWFVLNSSNNTVTISQFGSNGDTPIDGDFDGDGRNDLAIYRPTLGEWWFQRSSDNSVFAAQFGTSADKPSSGDYDKDGKTDIAIFRPSTGEWLILRSSSNFSTFFGYPFGANGDIPIVKKGA